MYEEQLEDEQDCMGLYSSELTKQLHLRNKQKREWDLMRKKMVLEEENEKDQRSRNEQMLDQDRLNEDQIELQETVVSKNLCSAMVRSVRANCDDTMKRSVELLQNQNGTEEFILFK